MRKLLTFIVTILAATAVLVVGVLVVAPSAGGVSSIGGGDPQEIDLALLDQYAIRSEVVASDGTVIDTLHGPENREPVSLDRVSQPVIDAILAVEDAEFYAHNGVNFRGMVRALFENVSAGQIEQGGSTITQQLVKKALLTDDRNLDRKSQEIPLALQLEQQLTKDEILEKYLNTVYFGAGAYGVEAAAETYWGQHADQLGYAEAAMLAALIANPVRFDPTMHPQTAYDRRRDALSRMVREEKITEDEAKIYASAPLPVRRCDGEVAALTCAGQNQQDQPDDYFVEEVKQHLLFDSDILGSTDEERYHALFDGGLRIYTTLDPRLQELAVRAQAAGVPPNDKGITAAMVTLDNSSGAVRAMVGGPDYAVQQTNVATDLPGRQTGSTFKIFTLLTALEQGNLPIDYISGGQSFPNPFGTPNPYKVDGAGGSLASVTQKSSNGAFVRLEQVVGLDPVIDMAKRLGVTTDLQPDLSLTLGVKSVPLIQMAAAYAAIPNEGDFNPSYLIDRIEDRDGEVIYEHESESSREFSEDTACYATSMLIDNVKYGTGTRARLPEMPSAGKTGTTDKNTDALFVGFTPYLTTAIWMGAPEVNPWTGQLPTMQNLNGVANFGGTYPAMMWKAFNEPANAPFAVRDFPTCAPYKRSARNVVGFGGSKLNEGRAPTSGSPSRSGTTTTTTRSGDDDDDGGDGGDGGGGGTTGTTSAPTTPTTGPAPTTPPDGGAGAEADNNEGGGE